MTPEEKQQIAIALVQQMSDKQKEQLEGFIFALTDILQNPRLVEISHQEERTSDQ